MGKTKKELVTADIHRKAGPHKVKEEEPVLCPKCKGRCLEVEDGLDGDWAPCTRCGGTGTIYEFKK